MNTSETEWLEKLFKQHKEDQQKYLDSKFDGLAEKISELKETVVDLGEEIEDVELACVECIDESETKTNKKIVLGSTMAVLLSLLLYAAFGTDAINVVLNFIRGINAF